VSGEQPPAVPPADPPPPGGSWPRLYAIVLGELALLVVLFWWFRRAFE
jgi:hypothetical protein